MSEYTPGPWCLHEKAFGYDLARADGGWLLQLHGGALHDDPPEIAACVGDEFAANARLMAAAPELLQALKELMHEYVPADDSEPDTQTRAVIDRCRAALAKATQP